MKATRYPRIRPDRGLYALVEGGEVREAEVVLSFPFRTRKTEVFATSALLDLLETAPQGAEIAIAPDAYAAIKPFFTRHARR